MLDGLASHGFVVVATRSCSVGCRDAGNLGWDKYYRESLKLMDWTKDMSQDPVLGLIDHSLGYGMSGHSMGGIATARACSLGIEEGYTNIVACVMHHPAPDDNGPFISRPLAGFTGTRDGCCGGDTTHNIFDPAPVAKTFANAIDKLHTEPNLFNTIWSAYTAAFIKDNMGIPTTSVPGVGLSVNNTQLIYGTSPDDLCGGFYPMDECYHVKAPDSL
jgi:hypothetical protein